MPPALPPPGSPRASPALLASAASALAAALGLALLPWPGSLLLGVPAGACALLALRARARERAWQDLLDSAPDAVLAVDAQGIVRFANRGAERMFRRAPAQLLGARAAELFDHPVRDALRALQAEALARAPEEPGPGVELRGLRGDGTAFPAELHVAPLRAAQGMARLTVRDATERSRREASQRRQARFVELVQAVAVASNQASTFEEAAQVALDQVCALTGWPVGHVHLAEPGGAMRPSGVWHIAPDARVEALVQATMARTLPPGEGLPGRVARSGEPAWILDLAADASIRRGPAVQRAGLRAGFAFPVVANGSVGAVLEFFAPATTTPDPLVLDAMMPLGAQLGRVLERQRAQEALRESEERFRSLIHSAPEIILHLDRDGRIMFMNRPGPGFRVEDVIGRSAYDFVLPEDRDGLRAVYEGVFRTGEPATLEVRTIAADGGVAWNRTSVGPMFRGGQVVALVITTSDVTDRKRDERALKESEQRFRAVAENANDAIVSADERGCITYFNPAAERTFGWRAEEVAGKPLALLLPERAQHDLPRLARGPGGPTVDLTGRRKDGTEFPLELSLASWRAGEHTYSTGVLRDVTERRRAEQDRLAAAERLAEVERLRELDKFKTQFINTAAHELGTPLTPIRVQLHLLKGTRSAGLSEDQRRSIGLLDRNVERLSNLVEDLLEVARIQAGKLGLRKQALDLDRVVLEAVESFQEPAKQRHLRLEARLAPDLVLEADAKRLTQVLFNLLSNALKFTPEGGSVVVETARAEGVALLRVRDSGIGMSQDAIARLFQPFTQVHDTMQRTAPGTGLGLYISRGIVELHGGRITAHSDGPGTGTTFTVALPTGLAPAPLPAPKPLPNEDRAPRRERGERAERSDVARRARDLV